MDAKLASKAANQVAREGADYGCPYRQIVKIALEAIRTYELLKEKNAKPTRNRNLS